MDDREVIRAFVGSAPGPGYGPNVHVEGDALLLGGWWHAAFRVAPETFILRRDEPPSPTRALDELAAELAARGLNDVGSDFPVIAALTYAQLSLGEGPAWALWARDRASGEAALAERIGAESFLEDAGLAESIGGVVDGAAPPLPDMSAELEGARRMVGLPLTVVVTVGLDKTRLNQLQVAMPECRFESVEVDGALQACGPLTPSLVLVNVDGRAALEFIMEFRADACGRFTPIVALTDGELPLGADVALAPDQEPLAWVEPLRRLLPG